MLHGRNTPFGALLYRRTIFCGELEEWVMMERYICIHGHFYQPPRENPWLGAIEIQDSAYPYHDWNEKITAECYAPNSAARILNSERKITRIVDNYSKISFNFGPTLLSWMETNAPDTYQAILEADRQSVESRSGHGNAIAQVYNHVIMPLSNSRDKRTQILWGIKDFEHRFRRAPEGMWLSETAVDLETLDICAKSGIAFVILAPHQASRVRKLKARKWSDVRGAIIDPTRVYLCKLPSGVDINVFFYNGPISTAVAFEKLLDKGENLVNRLLGGFSNRRNLSQFLNIATDGETYGHHFKFGDMALAYALQYIESNDLAKVTNYGEYLGTHRPAYEVEIIQNTSWSCRHGVERWRSNCGCNAGGHDGWNQEWRKPLRKALDWLRDRLAKQFERGASRYIKEPWDARDHYIDVILGQTPEETEMFFHRHQKYELHAHERITVRKLLEIQRNAMLMYTSCGWFFDELSGPETVQILQYAGRAVQLSEELSGRNMEQAFLSKIAKAKSNIASHGDGAHVYRKFVKPALVDLKKVAAYFAVSSLFEEYGDSMHIYSFTVKKEDYQTLRGGITSLAVGKVSVTSGSTGESETVSFSVLSLGGHDLNGGVQSFLGDEAYASMKADIIRTFKLGAIGEVIRLIDKHFETHKYSMTDLCRDEQRKLVRLISGDATDRFNALLQDMYDQNKALMNFVNEIGMPMPKAFLSAAISTLNSAIMQAFIEDPPCCEKIRRIANDIRRWNVPLDEVELEFRARRRVENMMNEFERIPSDLSLLAELKEMIELLKMMLIEMNYRHVQNTYYRMAGKTYGDFLSRMRTGDERATQWVSLFEEVGDILSFDVPRVIARPEGG
jgi:alpha-amylase/alpha-mannosidase (GH57 family)